MRFTAPGRCPREGDDEIRIAGLSGGMLELTCPRCGLSRVTTSLTLRQLHDELNDLHDETARETRGDE